LFFDVLLALCVNMTEDRFIDRGRHGVSASGDSTDVSVVCSARRLVWRQLKGFCMKARSFRFLCFEHDPLVETRTSFGYLVKPSSIVFSPFQ